MERQTAIDLEKPERNDEALRSYLDKLLLPAAQSRVLRLLAEGKPDNRAGQELRVTSMGKAEAAKQVGVAPNTFMAAVLALEERRVVGITRCTKPWTYVLSLTRLFSLESAEPVDLVAASGILGEETAAVGQGRSVPVSAPVSVSSNLSKIRSVPCSVPVSVTGAGDRRRPKGLAWSTAGGVTNDELRRAVRSGDLGPLRDLYQEAVKAGWIEDSPYNKRRFLIIAHHAAQPAINSPMGLFITRVRKGLDIVHVRQESHDWAERVLSPKVVDPPNAREVVHAQAARFKSAMVAAGLADHCEGGRLKGVAE